MIKELDKTMQKNLTPKLKAEGEKLKKEVKETQRRTNGLVQSSKNSFASWK